MDRYMQRSVISREHRPLAHPEDATKPLDTPESMRPKMQNGKCAKSNVQDTSAHPHFGGWLKMNNII